MNLELRLRRNTVLVGILGMLALGVAELNPVWLVLIAGVSVAAWVMERRSAPLAIGRAGLNAILLGAVAFAAVDYFFISRSWIVSLAHFLLLVQFAKLLLPKGDRDFGQIFVISLMNVAVAAVVATDVLFAATLVLYSGAIIRGLIFYHFHRELAAAKTVYLPVDEETARPTHAPEVRRVLSGRFLATLSAVIVAAWLANALFFALIPRLPSQLFHLAPMAWFNRLTGYSDTVTLGDIGRVMQSSAPVMRVGLRDNLRPWRGEHDLYFRGATYQHYDGNGWQRRGPEIEDLPGYRQPFLPMPGAPSLTVDDRKDYGRDDVVVQDIRLEPTASSAIFTLPGALPKTSLLDSPRTLFQQDCLDDTFAVFPTPTGPIHYLAWSVQDGSDRLYPPMFLNRARDPYAPVRLSMDLRRAYLQLPDEVTPRVREQARSIVASDTPPTPLDRAWRIEAWLKDKGNFSYTLDLKSTRGVEPVEDFLFNQKKGHCEYFASSMVVLLRAAGVPARLVTGFHGGEWNEVGGWFVVKQSDAHAWVEAFIDGDGWTRFDPTPAAERDRRAARAAMGPFGRWLDYFRASWLNNVVQFDQEQQSALLAGTRHATRRFTDWGERVLARAAGLCRSAWAVLTDLRRLTTTEGAIIFFGTLVVSTAVVLTARVLVLRLARALREGYARRRARRTGKVNVGFYLELQRLLRRRGLPARRDAETPLEFAESLASAFGPAEASLRALTDAYYRVRFGGAELTPDQEEQLRDHLERLRTSPVCRD